MHLSEATFRELERHFLGTLSVPARRSLAPVPGLSLLFTGAAPSPLADCAVDLGTVESPGAERREIAIANLGEEPLTLEILSTPPWLAAHWGGGGERVHLPCGGPGAALQLLAEHDLLTPSALAGRIRLLARALGGEEQVVEIEARLATRRTHPWGGYDFQGSPVPAPFDFGVIAAGDGDAVSPCVLAFASLTPVPLVVTFAGLPDWLAFEVDGHVRRGPVPGRFFEREAPFRATVQPQRDSQIAGARHGRLRLATNDPRPAYRETELEFTGRFAGPPAPISTRSIPHSGGEPAAGVSPREAAVTLPILRIAIRTEVLWGLLVLAALLLGLIVLTVRGAS